MAQTPSLVDLLKSGAHFGHQASKWHPKMKKFLFGERNGIHIINLEETQKALEEAASFVKKTTARGGIVLFVGTKKQASSLVEKAAQDAGMPYVHNRWLGGTLTNFSSIAQTVRRFKDLKRQQEKGELSKYTKFEQLKMNEQIKIMDQSVGGIQDMNRIPDAIFIFDIRKDKTALMEAVKRGVKVIAVCDSNVNPKDVDIAIPANDDALKAIEVIAQYMSAAAKEGHDEWEKGRAKLGNTLVQPNMSHIIPAKR